MIMQFSHTVNKRLFQLVSITTTISILLLSACASSPPAKTAAQLAHRQNTPMNWVKSPKLETIDPAFALSKNLPQTLFYIRGSLNTSDPLPSYVNKKDYLSAIENSDSGHAYDAFLAALAYRVGYFKRGRSRNATGKNYFEYRHYIKKSASLGWPEANMILFHCLNQESVISHIRDKLQSKCLYTGPTVDIKPSQKTARIHFNQAMVRGKEFDPNFIYKGNALPETQSLSAILYEWRATWESESLIAANQGWESPSNKLFPASGAAKRCKENLDYVMRKARFTDEVNICQGGSRSIQWNDTLASCPGAGYNGARNYLEACMSLTQSEEDWGYFFDQRIKLYHPREDRKLEIFNVGLAHYDAAKNHKKLSWLRNLKAKAAANTIAFQDTWDAKLSLLNAKTSASVARTKANKKEKQLRSARHQEKRNVEIRKLESMDKAHSAASKVDWNPTGDVFNDDLDRIKEQTMRNINSQQKILRGAASHSGVALDSQKTQPGASNNNNSKDCIHVTLGYLPDSRYSKSGKPWCDYDKIHRTYKNNLAEQRKKNEYDPNDCPTGVWLGPKVLIKSGSMKGTYTRKRVYYDTGECDRQTK